MNREYDMLRSFVREFDPDAAPDWPRRVSRTNPTVLNGELWHLDRLQGAERGPVSDGGEDVVDVRLAVRRILKAALFEDDRILSPKMARAAGKLPTSCRAMTSGESFAMMSRMCW